MTQSTFVFSIGPVQGFIAQSRRTADGWVGSFLLSYLAGQGIHAIKQAGGAIEEPATDGLALYEAIDTGTSGGDTTIASIPNVIVAGLGDSLKPDDIGKKAWDEAAAKWKAIVAAMWNVIPMSLKKRSAFADVWNRQTAQPWEGYWAWGKDSREAFINLAARKGLRDFDQIAEGGDRCTVCAQREALWDRNEPRGPNELDRDVIRRLWRAWREALIDVCEDTPQMLFQPEGKERLCAICLIKRMIPWTENPIHDIWKSGKSDTSMPWVFPSTSTVATNLYRVKLLEHALADSSVCTAIKDYHGAIKDLKQAKPRDPLDQFPKWKKFHDENRAKASAQNLPLDKLLRLDGDWYLYGPAVKNEYGLSEDEDNALRAAYQEVSNAIRKAEIGIPPRYWALVTMDGDRMGDFKKACADQRIDTKQISEKLNEFSRMVPDIVRRKHNGRVVYAGGDDVLAFLPVETALDAAEGLRREYERLFDEWAGKDELRRTLRLATSLSGSIIFAHHQAPLGAVIRQGHSLLTDWGKRRAGRNALAIQIYRRGGPDTTFAAQWTFTSKWEDASPISLVKRLGELEEKLASGAGQEMARGFAYRLRDDSWMFRAAGPLYEKDDDQADYVAALLEKSRLRGQANSAIERREMALRAARDLLDLCRVAVGEGGSDGLAVEPLLVARFLASGGREER